ncbi:MAG: endo-1,4-beta-xylanase [Lentisphaeria bacterium]
MKKQKDFSIEACKNFVSKEYLELWNNEVQDQIDQNIETNRKANGSFKLDGVLAGTTVKIEQTKSEFIFGAHIFNFDQLGTDERNCKYKELFGTLFNSATIAFYWKTLEPEEGHPRFHQEYRDTADFWNNCPNPKYQPHWRRPATDPVVDFCLKKGVRLHGHTMVWGNNRWQIPDWLIQKIPLELIHKVDLTSNAPELKLLSDSSCGAVMKDMSPDQFAETYPEYTEQINQIMARRIIQLALRYGDKIDSWDIVNESATDFGADRMIPGSKICNSRYCPMPGDYTYRAFKIAESILPAKAKLNINDYNLSESYLNQVKDLQKRNCKIDIMGAQMHLFDPQICLDIASGTSQRQSPEQVINTFNLLEKANLPIHLSEITITSPNNDEKGQAIQAVLAYNLYRLWFSIKPMMGITWWNVVDDCGAPKEPAVSGLFSKDMNPKPAYFALNDLINNQWKTNTTALTDKEGTVSFRGFCGTYRLSWEDADGKKHTKEVVLSK